MRERCPFCGGRLVLKKGKTWCVGLEEVEVKNETRYKNKTRQS